MPNLQIIKTLSEQKKVTLRKIAEVAGMTEQGLHKAINKEDIRFGSLDKIANFLKVELSLFSDYPLDAKAETGVLVNGHNSGNIAGGNITQITLPEKGTQKIIKPDGTTIIVPITGDGISQREEELLNTIALQKQLIDSLQAQVNLLNK
ncbi:MAG: hypothetical protein LBS20_11005 [Prevotella sp.]|jgi:DNA-binding Xre family transcriptional regulator|nr:hypothetical protein [Prevotella sp.]